MESVEVKIKRLDAELMKYRDQMKRMREGPAKVHASLFRYSMLDLMTNIIEFGKAKGHEGAAAKEDV